MNFFYLITAILGASLENVFKKQYNQKNENLGSCTFSFMILPAAAMFFLLISGGNLTYEPKILPYTICGGIGYAVANICTVLALLHGSLALTTLIISYSRMLPTLFGLVFLHEPVSPFLIIGLVLLVISLFLTVMKKEKHIISLKWGVLTFFAFLCNGMIAVVQKMQQDTFCGAYKSELMIGILLIAMILTIPVILTKERKEAAVSLKNGWYFALYIGICNGANNLFTLVLTQKMPASVLYPLLSGGGIIMTWIFARFFYKEHFSRVQTIGLLMGIASVVLLNV